MAITYLAHDLADPAVSRRMAMLQKGGAEVDLLGFYRSAEPPAEVAGLRPHPLGQTRDGRFAERILSIFAARCRLKAWSAPFEGSTCIIARNLEMLYLAAAAKKQTGSKAPLFYELLDIHRLMLGDGTVTKAMLRLERHLIAQCAGIIISSSAFNREYLAQRFQGLPPILLWENKVMPKVGVGQVSLPGNMGMTMPPPPVAQRPWRIGWFGAIRCRRSLLCLAKIAREHPGLIEVDIRGRVTEVMGNDFSDIVANTPGLTYHGPYRYPDDLQTIYAPVHFVWAIDFYEAGLNSSWLLPNRLYEGGYCRRVPIALADVETGRWLAAHHLGCLLSGDLEPATQSLLTGMTAGQYQAAIDRSMAADLSWFVLNDQACHDMVASLMR